MTSEEKAACKNVQVIESPFADGSVATRTVYRDEEGNVIAEDFRLKVPTIQVGVANGRL